MTRTMTVLALAGAGAMLCGQAQADVIYTFTGNPPAADPVFAPKLQIEVTDAAIAAGSLILRAAPGNTLIGDASGFVGLSQVYLNPLPSSYQITPFNDGTYRGYDRFDINLAFAPDGSLAGGGGSSINVNDGPDGDSFEVFVNGGYQFGYDGAAADRQGCMGAVTTCRGIGTWAMANSDPSPVPEPASFALLGAGLVGLGAVRWRQLKA